MIYFALVNHHLRNGGLRNVHLRNGRKDWRNYDRIRDLVLRDYAVFSGKALESYFAKKLAETGKWTQIGHWWDRKGENEIDLVAVDELEKRILFGEVKRSAERIRLGVLRGKAEAFLRAHSRYAAYAPDYQGFSLAEM